MKRGRPRDFKTKEDSDLWRSEKNKIQRETGKLMMTSNPEYHIYKKQFIDSLYGNFSITHGIRF